jgi:hypothetical protein
LARLLLTTLPSAELTAAVGYPLVRGTNMNRDFLSVDIFEMVIVLAAAAIASFLYF